LPCPWWVKVAREIIRCGDTIDARDGKMPIVRAPSPAKVRVGLISINDSRATEL
jgi:hypothetical protein